ncbi:Hypothetical predicted protein, partial [Paramuricea clavata]
SQTEYWGFHAKMKPTAPEKVKTFQSLAHKKYHEDFSELIPNLQESYKNSKKYFFHGYHTSLCKPLQNLGSSLIFLFTESPEQIHIDLEKRLEVAEGKKDERLQNTPNYMTESLDIVTAEVMLKINGVVRIQRHAIKGKRAHGSGTGILVRLNWSQTQYTVKKSESEDFAILTNNHLIENDSELNGSTVDFFYNAAAGDADPHGQGVVTKNVTKVIAWSPKAPSGQEAADECMDFSILKFDMGTDEEFIKTLGEVALYLNEFLQNDLPTTPHLDFPIPLLIIAISHPHGSNKRISFGSVEEEELRKRSIQYNLTTCQGCSGCPVLAIQMDAKGYLRAALQFLHFRQTKGIVVRKLYETCKANADFAWEYGLFGSPLVSREMTSQTPTGLGAS